jgi:patatin-like phospholipase
MPDQATVVVVTGHMIDAPDRPDPRFPPDQVRRVTAEAAAALERWGVGPGTTVVTGGARGADIIVAELAHKRGATVQLVLALPAEEFVRRSVDLPETDWTTRFREVLENAGDCEVIGPPHDDGVFARANARIIELAREIDPAPHAVVVWNGREGDGPGGTRDFVARLGHTGPDERVRVIDPTPRRYEQRQEPVPPKKILALDGGGIRGVLSLEILAALEAKLRQRYGQDEYVLANFFDYIGGTSTGAIIAAGLALGKPVSVIRDEYEKLGPRIFRKRWLPLRLRSLYRDRALTSELVDFFGAARTLGDPGLETLLLVVMHNSVTDSVWPLSNCTQAKYNRADRYLKDTPDRNLDLPLTTLVRGSTAAPLYFAPQELRVGAQEFVFEDGGVTPFNNPAMLMFLMATLPEYGLRWPTGEDALLIVSVGTGAAPAAHAGLSGRKMHLGFQAKNLPSVFMNGASVGQDVMARSFGRTRIGAPIDLEFGDRIDASSPTGTDAFTYARLNADLSPAALAAAGISDPERQARLRKLDAVDCMPQLQELGRRVGETLDLDRHLGGFV